MTPANPPTVVRYLTAALGTADGPTDAALLGRFADGRDQAAFELLVWRHAGMVLRVCRGVVHDHHTAEDVAQAAFLALARKAGSIGKRDAVAGWLYRVARRLAVRTAVRRTRYPTPTADLDGVPARSDRDTDDLSPRLHDELARLPEKYRLPVLLCFFEGLTHADAARRLGWPVGTVAGRLARAKDLLHRRLARRGVAVPAVGALGLLAADAAAVPAAFADGTARAAVAFAAGEAVVPGVSNFTLELAKGAIRTMTVTKLQWAAAVVAVCGSLTAGGVWAMGQGAGAPPGAGAPGSAPGSPTAGEPPAPAERTADYAQRQRSLKNVKAILIAMHNYHDTYGRFPPDIADKDGKPLLSWRVQLLPYLEQDALYRAFRKDQPWDSEHNLRLLAQMPPVYRTGIEPKDATHTYYQRFALSGSRWSGVGDGGAAPAGAGGGPGTADSGGALGAPQPLGPGGFAPPAIPAGGRGPGPGGPVRSRFPLRLAEITDGTSNTLALAEVGPAVAWTKPGDVEVDLSKPMPKLWGPFANVVTAGAFDGAAYFLRPDLGGAVLKKYIDPSDGEVVAELRTLQARFPADSAEEKKTLARLLEENQVLIAAIEKQIEEHAALLALMSKSTNDVGKAEEQQEQQEQLKVMLEGMRAKNKKLRDELGLRPGSAVPKQ